MMNQTYEQNHARNLYDCCNDALAYKIEQTIKQELAPPLRDISFGLAKKLAETIHESSSAAYLTRREALDHFDKELMKREIKTSYGNLRQLVRNAYGPNEENVDNLRRNIYRKIRKFNLTKELDSARPWKPKCLEEITGQACPVSPKKIENALSSTLQQYKSMIHPELYVGLCARIKEKAQYIAERIAPYTPTLMNWVNYRIKNIDLTGRHDEAKAEFESQVIRYALIAAGSDKKKAAKYLGDSLRTLNRRINALGIEENPKTEKIN